MFTVRRFDKFLACIESITSSLGGGFKYFLFSPLLGEMILFAQYFSNGLKLPTSSFMSQFLALQLNEPAVSQIYRKSKTYLSTTEPTCFPGCSELKTCFPPKKQSYTVTPLKINMWNIKK